jgi:hypothetical protein
MSRKKRTAAARPEPPEPLAGRAPAPRHAAAPCKPPKPNKPFLVAAAALLVAWIVFLVALAAAT